MNKSFFTFFFGFFGIVTLALSLFFVVWFFGQDMGEAPVTAHVERVDGE